MLLGLLGTHWMLLLAGCARLTVSQQQSLHGTHATSCSWLMCGAGGFSSLGQTAHLRCSSCAAGGGAAWPAGLGGGAAPGGRAAAALHTPFGVTRRYTRSAHAQGCAFAEQHRDMPRSPEMGKHSTGLWMHMDSFSRGLVCLV